jgi:hypothetical protein
LMLPDPQSTHNTDTTTICKGFRKPKHNHVAGLSVVKPGKPRNCVPVGVDVAQALYNNTTPCLGVERHPPSR